MIWCDDLHAPNQQQVHMEGGGPEVERPPELQDCIEVWKNRAKLGGLPLGIIVFGSGLNNSIF